MSEDKRKNLRDLLDEFDDYFRDFEREITESVKNGIFSPDPHSRPFIAGFAFNLGADGKPTLQVFGDNPVHKDGFRSPINEQIIDEKNGVLRIIIEMPGVEKEDIKVEATEDSAMVTAEKDEKRYKAELSLKAPVRADSGKAEYKNGMLEISFSLKDKANKGFRRVNVV
jgi:HSP20 family protein